MVVAELFSVVRGKEKYRIVIKFLFDESHDQTSDLVVQMGDAGVVSYLRLTYKFRVFRACPGVKDPALFL